ncbi:MAG TPA: hypothetical protein VMW47_00850 [Verrucomicrobiae bacterium]|nr:hypothetical protein [Verrucomicrobiae bacterium]
MLALPRGAPGRIVDPLTAGWPVCVVSDTHFGHVMAFAEPDRSRSSRLTK